MTPFEKVQQFHEIFGAHQGHRPGFPDQQERQLRQDLLAEEFAEYQDAESRCDLVEVADALADMLYIIYGTAVSYGIPIDRVFDEVHRSNMSKLNSDGQVLRRQDGKVLKGPNYTPPNVRAVLENACASTV
jgi:predicted HAD superfamily Cof-like phosphohydrolase